MSTENIKDQFVLSYIDASSFSEAVCDYSAWITKAIDMPLKLLHTIDNHSFPAVTDLSGAIGLGARSDLLEELTELEQSRGKLLIKKGQIMLDAAKKHVQSQGIENVITKQRHGSLSESLVELEKQIRVLVIAVRGEEHNDHIDHGSQLETLIRSLHKPILVVNKEFSLPKKIMLAYNGKAASKKVVQMVANSKLFKNLPCHLVNVSNDKERSSALLQEASNVLSAGGIEHISMTLTGKIDDALIEYRAEQDIDLTLMGAASHHRVRDFLLGSFTAKMLERTKRPLLLLR